MKGSKPFLQLLLGILVSAILSGCAAKAPQNGPGALNIAQFALAQGVPGISYRQLLIASGGVQPYTWSITSGSLPPGLNLTSDGIISGTPTMTGTSNFTIKVVDSQSPVQAFTTQNFSIMINPVLSLASMTLPNGIVGNSYLTTVEASNGVAPYAYTLAFGSLPPCAPNPPCTNGTMTLTSDMPPMGGGANTGSIRTPNNGMTLSTLSDAGVYNFTIQATDSLGEVATATFSITVTGRLQGPYAFTLNGYNQGQPFYTVGSFIADGNGNITSGVLDQASASGVNTNVTFTGTYNLPVGSTTGTITITSALGTSNYSIAVSTTGDSELIETDMNVYGSGLVKKQSTTTLPLSASAYAFGLFGSDSGGNGYAGAGVFAVDSNLNVTGGEEDTNDNGTASGQLAITGGALVNPDGTTGRGTFTLTVGGTTYNYVYYTTSLMTNELVAVETDSGGPMTLVDILPQISGNPNGFLPSALACQGPGACSVMTVNGVTGSGMSAVSQAAVGTATFDGMGHITRSGIDTLPGFFMDQSVGGTVTSTPSCSANVCYNGTYNVDTMGRVTTTLTDLGGNQVPNPPVWYLVTKNQGFVVGTDAAVTSGKFVPQSGAPFSLPSLLGSYLGGTITPTTSSVTNELDVAGTPPPGGMWAVKYDTNGPGGPSQMQQTFMGPYMFDSTYGTAFGRFTVATTGGLPVDILYVAGSGAPGATGSKAGLIGLNVGKYDGSADPNPRLTSLGR